MKNLWIASVLAVACAASLAKIPPPVLDDAAKAKAAEAAAKTAWQAKVDAYQLCKVQDRVAAYYRSHAGAAAKDPKMTPTSSAAAAPGAAAATPAVPAASAGAKAAAATAAAPTAAMGNVSANPAVAGGTASAPAGAPTPTGCADPGPFAVNAPAEKPLETSGAHSPAGNATSPPSVRANSSEMAPAKK